MVPDFIICTECETPCYTFEWKRDEIAEAMCEACGNDDLDVFATPEDWEALAYRTAAD